MNEQSGDIPIRVTDWDDPGDADLLSWFYWYRDKGIPAAVVFDENRKSFPNAVSIWRIGKCAVRKPETMRPSYGIVKECHGFSRWMR